MDLFVAAGDLDDNDAMVMIMGDMGLHFRLSGTAGAPCSPSCAVVEVF